MQTKKPNLLDIARIDERWVQVCFDRCHIMYLNNSSFKRINWNDYKLVRSLPGLSVGYLIQHGERFTNQEVANIHWGPEDKEHPNLKLEVRVFGEYLRKG